MRRRALVIAALVGIAVSAWWWQGRPTRGAGDADASAADPVEPDEPPVVEQQPVPPRASPEVMHPAPQADPQRHTERERVRRALSERWHEAAEEAPILPGSAFRDAMVEDLIPLVKECQSLAGGAGRFRAAFNLLGAPDVGGFVESVELLDENELDDPAFLECVEQSALSITFDADAAGRNRLRMSLRLGKKDTETE